MAKCSTWHVDNVFINAFRLKFRLSNSISPKTACSSKIPKTKKIGKLFRACADQSLPCSLVIFSRVRFCSPADLILKVVVSGTYTAEMKQNVGTFLAFLCSSNWYEWYVGKGPGVEFKVRLMSLWRRCAAARYARAHSCSHECNFPKHMDSCMDRILQLKIISVDVTFANHVAAL